VQEDSPLEKAS